MRLVGGSAIASPSLVPGQNPAIYLPFDITSKTSISLNLAHVSVTGVDASDVEQLQIQFFPTQSGSIDSSQKHTNLVLPTLGQTITRMDSLDLQFFQHLTSSQAISPVVTCVKFDGTRTLNPSVHVHLSFTIEDQTMMPMGQRGAQSRSFANNKFVSGGSVLESINDKVDTTQITNQMRARFM